LTKHPGIPWYRLDVPSARGSAALSNAARVPPPLYPPRHLHLRHAAGRRRVGSGRAPGPAPVGVGAALRRPRLQHLLAHVLRRRPRHAPHGHRRPRRGGRRRAQCLLHLGLQRRRLPRAAAEALLLRRGGLPGELGGLLRVGTARCLFDEMRGRVPCSIRSNCMLERVLSSSNLLASSAYYISSS